MKDKSISELYAIIFEEIFKRYLFVFIIAVIMPIITLFLSTKLGNPSNIKLEIFSISISLISSFFASFIMLKLIHYKTLNQIAYEVLYESSIELGEFCKSCNSYFDKEFKKID